MLRKTVQDPYSGDWKSSVAVEDICKPGRPACDLSAMEFSASSLAYRSGVMWSHFDDAKTSRASALITDCKRRARCSGMPANNALQ